MRQTFSKLDFNWKREGAIDRLKELYKAGTSDAQIAVTLNEEFNTTGITRNAVIGARHRHVNGKYDPATCKYRPARKPKPPRPVAVADFLFTPKKPRPVAVEALPPDEKASLNFGPSRLSKSVPPRTDFSLNVDLKLRCDPVAFADLEDGDCRWPLDGGMYCGRPALLRKSYCSVHARVSSKNAVAG